MAGKSNFLDIKSSRKILWICGFILLLSSCDKNRIYERNENLANHEWYYNQTIPFEVEIVDTTATYNIFLNVRHSTDFDFTNLWINLSTYYPSGVSGRLSEQILLGDNLRQQWLGDCMSDICDRQDVIVEGIKFNEIGIYKFEVEQVMRVNPLPKVMSVGLRVERRRI